MGCGGEVPTPQIARQEKREGSSRPRSSGGGSWQGQPHGSCGGESDGSGLVVIVVLVVKDSGNSRSSTGSILVLVLLLVDVVVAAIAAAAATTTTTAGGGGAAAAVVVVVVVVVVGEGEAAAAVTSLVAISGLPLPSCFASHGEVREEETAATASVLRAPPPRLGGSMLEAPRGCGGDTSSSRPEHARPLMSVMLEHAYMFMAVSVIVYPSDACLALGTPGALLRLHACWMQARRPADPTKTRRPIAYGPTGCNMSKRGA